MLQSPAESTGRGQNTDKTTSSLCKDPFTPSESGSETRKIEEMRKLSKEITNNKEKFRFRSV